MLFNKSKKLLKKILFVDGQPGCGKTLFNRIFNSFDNVEIFKYATEIENITSFYFHNKISFDAAKFFIETYADEILYSQMMSRNTNFRYSDLSSVLQSDKKSRYFLRLFNKGDEKIPKIINSQNPILHFATHNLLPRSEVVFKTFNEKLRFINIVRHPLYMIQQQALNHQEFKKNPARQFLQTFKYKETDVPFFWEENLTEYHLIKNNFEKAIIQMSKVEKLTLKIEKIINNKYKNNFLKIPFEQFVLNPKIYKKKIEKFLNVEFSHNVLKTMKKEKVPRLKITEGRDTKIYRKYGWTKGSKNLTEIEEINKKLQFIKDQKLSQKCMDKLMKLSENYEKRHMKDLLS